MYPMVRNHCTWNGSSKGITSACKIINGIVTIFAHKNQNLSNYEPAI